VGDAAPHPIKWRGNCPLCPPSSLSLNPFNKTGHSYKKKNMRPVLPWMLEKIPSLVPGARICDSCTVEKS